MEVRRERRVEEDKVEERREYSAPRLVHYGDLTKLTESLDKFDPFPECTSWGLV